MQFHPAAHAPIPRFRYRCLQRMEARLEISVGAFLDYHNVLLCLPWNMSCPTSHRFPARAACKVKCSLYIHVRISMAVQH